MTKDKLEKKCQRLEESIAKFEAREELLEGDIAYFKEGVDALDELIQAMTRVLNWTNDAG